VFDSETRKKYEVLPSTLCVTEKFGVLYARVPREVHVAPSGDDAYSIAVPLYQNTQCVFDEESKKLLRAPSVVEFVEFDCPTMEVCACETCGDNKAIMNTSVRGSDTKSAQGLLRVRGTPFIAQPFVDTAS
jgi:hypothetical protein